MQVKLLGSVAVLAVSAMLALHIPARAAEPNTLYLVGRGVADITGPPIGVKMLGYVRPDQISEGIHLRQWSRAFIVAEPGRGRRLAIVTTDLQSVTHSMVLSVLDKLRARFGELRPNFVVHWDRRSSTAVEAARDGCEDLGFL